MELDCRETQAAVIGVTDEPIPGNTETHLGYGRVIVHTLRDGVLTPTEQVIEAHNLTSDDIPASQPIIVARFEDPENDDPENPRGKWWVLAAKV